MLLAPRQELPQVPFPPFQLLLVSYFAWNHLIK